MTVRVVSRFIISVFLCFTFGHACAQDVHSEISTKTKNTNRSEYDVFRSKRDSTFTPQIAIKTNMLYWIGVMPDFKYYSFLPNLEVEWFFCPQWSVSFSGAYSKWGIRKDKFFGVSSWSAEPRFWPGKYRNAELYIGLYAQIGDFDNQDLHIKEYGNTGDFYGAGLSLGAYIPLGKKWGAEFGIKTGYEHIQKDVYSYETQHYFRESVHNKNKWGITGVNASISYRFGKIIK